MADWFTARGFRAFILSYRLTSHGYLLPVPLLDARRAIQTVRARAADYHIDPNRIVVIGFSAGGHLAALAATQFVPGNPDAEDPIDRVSSRPDYPGARLPLDRRHRARDTSHLNYCKMFNLMDQCDAAARRPTRPICSSPKTRRRPSSTTPSTTRPFRWSRRLRFYDALVKAGVPSELHVFANGAHGSGLGKGDPALDQWPDLLENWLRARGC